MQVLLRICSD